MPSIKHRGQRTKGHGECEKKRAPPLRVYAGLCGYASRRGGCRPCVDMGGRHDCTGTDKRVPRLYCRQRGRQGGQDEKGLVADDGREREDNLVANIPRRPLPSHDTAWPRGGARVRPPVPNVAGSPPDLDPSNVPLLDASQTSSSSSSSSSITATSNGHTSSARSQPNISSHLPPSDGPPSITFYHLTYRAPAAWLPAQHLLRLLLSMPAMMRTGSISQSTRSSCYPYPARSSSSSPGPT